MEKKELKCPICGEPTNVYMGKARKDCLCYKHGRMANSGEISQCTDCGKWNKKGTTCECKKAKEENKVENELACLVCGEPSNGKHFCIKCWNKYKDKSIDLRITHCNTTQILDEYGNKTKKAKDGRFVRSLSEKIILDYFFDNYIRVIYEKTIPYINEKGEEKELHPDFYLKDHDLYIEFNGLTNKSYLKMKEYVNKIYKEKGLKVEILESEDIDDIEKTMEKLLSKYPKK
ncbi:MAG: hypothetical protein J6C23_09280 [Clostridia bacterium]|nr:hypothetical protein [Clostridia bacterium]